MGIDARAFDPFGDRLTALDLDAGGLVCVQLPRRVIPYLLGGLNPLRWPDAWTGDPTAINLVNSQIENVIAALMLRNCPQEPCPECPSVPPTAPPGLGGTECLCEDDEMACIEIGSLIKIENGVLYVKDACGTWLSVGSLESPQETVPEGTYTPLLPAGADFTSCGKATAITTAINAVADAMWDARNAFPWQWLNLVENNGYVPDLKNTWVANGVMQAILLDVGFGVDDIFDATSLQRVKCKIAEQVGGNDGPLTDDEWSAIKNSYYNQFGTLIGNLYGHAYSAIGREALSNIGAAGAATQDGDCDCPAVNPEGFFGPVVWARSYSAMPRCNGTYTFVGRSNNGLTVEHQFVSIDNGFAALGQTWPFDIQLGTSITEIVIAHESLNAATGLLHETWNPAGGCAPITTENTCGELAPAGTRSEKVVNNILYQRSVFSPAVTALGIANGEMRVCPQPPVTPRTYQWKNHIVSINNVDTGIFPNVTWP